MKWNIPLILIGAFTAYACYKVLGNQGGSGPLGAGPAFIHSAQDAVQAATEQHKPLVLVFSAAWCGPCKMMKKQVYPSPQVMPYLSKFVWGYADVDDPKNASLAQRYGVSGIPHIQLIGSDGKSRGQIVGSTSPDNFAEALSKLN